MKCTDDADTKCKVIRDTAGKLLKKPFPRGKIKKFGKESGSARGKDCVPSEPGSVS